MADSANCDLIDEALREGGFYPGMSLAVLLITSPPSNVPCTRAPSHSSPGTHARLGKLGQTRVRCARSAFGKRRACVAHFQNLPCHGIAEWARGVHGTFEAFCWSLRARCWERAIRCAATPLFMRLILLASHVTANQGTIFLRAYAGRASWHAVTGCCR